MTIWVDADSCPVRVREIIAKAAFRLSLPTIFVANRDIPIKKNEFVSSVVTSSKEQSADVHIISSAREGDLVITRDIPLAAQLVDKDIAVINDRGAEFEKESVRERLSIRNFMYEAHLFGIVEEKVGQFGKKDVQKFSATFDRVLTRLIRQSPAR